MSGNIKEMAQPKGNNSIKCPELITYPCTLLTHRELEDLYLATSHANIELKKTINDLLDKVKILKTRLRRMEETQTNGLSKERKDCCASTRALLQDKISAVEELMNANNQLMQKNRILNTRLNSMKQFSKQSNTSGCKPFGSGKQSSSRSLNRENPSRGSAEATNKDVEKAPSTTSSRRENSSHVHSCTHEARKKSYVEVTEVGSKYKIQIEELKERVVELTQKLTKAQSDCNERILELEQQITELEMERRTLRMQLSTTEQNLTVVQSDRCALAELLRETEAKCAETEMELTFAKKKVMELETQMKFAQWSAEVNKVIKHHEGPSSRENYDKTYSKNLELLSRCDLSGERGENIKIKKEVCPSKIRQKPIKTEECSQTPDMPCMTSSYVQSQLEKKLKNKPCPVSHGCRNFKQRLKNFHEKNETFVREPCPKDRQCPKHHTCWNFSGFHNPDSPCPQYNKSMQRRTCQRVYKQKYPIRKSEPVKRIDSVKHRKSEKKISCPLPQIDSLRQRKSEKKRSTPLLQFEQAKIRDSPKRQGSRKSWIPSHWCPRPDVCKTLKEPENSNFSSPRSRDFSENVVNLERSKWSDIEMIKLNSEIRNEGSESLILTSNLEYEQNENPLRTSNESHIAYSLEDRKCPNPLICKTKQELGNSTCSCFHARPRSHRPNSNLNSPNKMFNDRRCPKPHNCRYLKVRPFQNCPCFKPQHNTKHQDFSNQEDLRTIYQNRPYTKTLNNRYIFSCICPNANKPNILNNTNGAKSNSSSCKTRINKAKAVKKKDNIEIRGPPNINPQRSKNKKEKKGIFSCICPNAAKSNNFNNMYKIIGAKCECPSCKLRVNKATAINIEIRDEPNVNLPQSEKKKEKESQADIDTESCQKRSNCLSLKDSDNFENYAYSKRNRVMQTTRTPEQGPLKPKNLKHSEQTKTNNELTKTDLRCKCFNPNTCFKKDSKNDHCFCSHRIKDKDNQKIDKDKLKYRELPSAPILQPQRDSSYQHTLKRPCTKSDICKSFKDSATLCSSDAQNLPQAPKTTQKENLQSNHNLIPKPQYKTKKQLKNRAGNRQCQNNTCPTFKERKTFNQKSRDIIYKRESPYETVPILEEEKHWDEESEVFNPNMLCLCPALDVFCECHKKAKNKNWQSHNAQFKHNIPCSILCRCDKGWETPINLVKLADINSENQETNKQLWSSNTATLKRQVHKPNNKREKQGVEQKFREREFASGKLTKTKIQGSKIYNKKIQISKEAISHRETVESKKQLFLKPTFVRTQHLKMSADRLPTYTGPKPSGMVDDSKTNDDSGFTDHKESPNKEKPEPSMDLLIVSEISDSLPGISILNPDTSIDKEPQSQSIERFNQNKSAPKVEETIRQLPEKKLSTSRSRLKTSFDDQQPPALLAEAIKLNVAAQDTSKVAQDEKHNDSGFDDVRRNKFCSDKLCHEILLKLTDLQKQMDALKSAADNNQTKNSSKSSQNSTNWLEINDSDHPKKRKVSVDRDNFENKRKSSDSEEPIVTRDMRNDTESCHINDAGNQVPEKRIFERPEFTENDSERIIADKHKLNISEEEDIDRARLGSKFDNHNDSIMHIPGPLLTHHTIIDDKKPTGPITKNEKKLTIHGQEKKRVSLDLPHGSYNHSYADSKDKSGHSLSRYVKSKGTELSVGSLKTRFRQRNLFDGTLNYDRAIEVVPLPEETADVPPDPKQLDLCPQFMKICICPKVPNKEVALFRTCSGSLRFTTNTPNTKQCPCADAKYMDSTVTFGAQADATTFQMNLPTPGNTYNINELQAVVKCERTTSPDNTDYEISSIVDTSTYGKLPTPVVSPGEDGGGYSTTYSSPFGPYVDTANLSDGEVPVCRAGTQLSLGEKPAPLSLCEKPTPLTPHAEERKEAQVQVSNRDQVEAALQSITEELQRCKMLLQNNVATQRPEQRDKRDAGVAAVAPSESTSRLALKKCEAKPAIGDVTAPKCSFTLHIGTVVFSDEAVISSRDIPLALTWQFYDQALAMTRLTAGRVVPVNFTIEYDVKFNDSFSNFMKNEEMVIQISDVNKLDKSFAKCLLPLRDALLHTNRRVDMSLALLRGDVSPPRRSRDTFEQGECGVLDLWCMLHCDPTLLPTLRNRIKLASVRRASSTPKQTSGANIQVAPSIITEEGSEFTLQPTVPLIMQKGSIARVMDESQQEEPVKLESPSFPQDRMINQMPRSFSRPDQSVNQPDHSFYPKSDSSQTSMSRDSRVIEYQSDTMKIAFEQFHNNQEAVTSKPVSTQTKTIGYKATSKWAVNSNLGLPVEELNGDYPPGVIAHEVNPWPKEDWFLRDDSLTKKLLNKHGQTARDASNLGVNPEITNIFLPVVREDTSAKREETVVTETESRSAGSVPKDSLSVMSMKSTIARRQFENELKRASISSKKYHRDNPSMFEMLENEQWIKMTKITSQNEESDSTTRKSGGKK